MRTKLFAIVCGLVFWHLGLVSVMSWHGQQEHQDAQVLYMKPIQNAICFVDIAN